MLSPKLFSVCSPLPCLVDKLNLEPSQRERLKTVYKTIKAGNIGTGVTIIVVSEGRKLMIDAAQNKLKNLVIKNYFS